ncbi:MAG: diguanylate cyclase [Acidobacteriaceae bacterium]|nr:diguanylate cyclase [Acidobacteriaceae bacterium]
MVTGEQFEQLTQLSTLNLMLDASVDCIKLIDCEGRLLKMNRAGCEALGVQQHGSMGMKWLPLLPPEVRSGGRKALKACIAMGKRASFAGKSQLPGDDPVYWDNVLTPLKGEDGSVIAVLCVSRNITRQRVAERKLRVASDFDALSEIPNRRYFVRHAEAIIRAGAKRDGSIGVLLLDVDRFKFINDSMGHHVGDATIKHLAKLLKSKLLEGEFLARLGGDEFALIKSSTHGSLDMKEVAARCMTAVQGGFLYRGEQIPLQFSIGGSVVSSRKADLSLLLKVADVALYKCKMSGRGRYLVEELQDAQSES